MNIDTPTPISAIPTCSSCALCTTKCGKSDSHGTPTWVSHYCNLFKMKTGNNWTCVKYTPKKINGYEKEFQKFINKEFN